MGPRQELFSQTASEHWPRREVVCNLHLLFPQSALPQVCSVAKHTAVDCRWSWSQRLERRREEGREIWIGERDRLFWGSHSGGMEGGFVSIGIYSPGECSQMGGPNSSPSESLCWGPPLAPSSQSSSVCEIIPTFLVLRSLQRPVITLIEDSSGIYTTFDNCLFWENFSILQVLAFLGFLSLGTFLIQCKPMGGP